MRKLPIAIVALAALIPAGPAFAQEEGRYRLERSGDGFVRMDAHTGVMSFCEQASGQLVCKPAADERAAYSAHVEGMERLIEELEGRVAALEREAAREPAPALPSTEEFEQSLTFMERFFRRFIDIVRDLEGETGGDRPPSVEPAPRG